MDNCEVIPPTIHKETHQSPPTGLFTSEQHQGLLALLHQASPSSTTNAPKIHTMANNSTSIPSSLFSSDKDYTWDLGTSATNHICHCENLFKSLNTIPIITIKFPNYGTITINQIGTIEFTYDFYLTNMLFILSFLTNLISIPRRKNNLDCNLFLTLVLTLYRRTIP